MNLLQSDNTIDVVHSELLNDYELFFGPLLPDAMPLVYDGNSLAEVLVKLGLAPSMTFCRKNNWNRTLAPGYNEIVYGSKRVKVCILTKDVSK